MKPKVLDQVSFYCFYSLGVGKAIQNDPLLKSINSNFWHASRKKWIPITLNLHNVSLLLYNTISVARQPKNHNILRGVL